MSRADGHAVVPTVPTETGATGIVVPRSDGGDGVGPETALAARATLWRRLIGQPGFIVGAVVLLALLAFCFVGPVFYHSDQVRTNLAGAVQRPGSGHPLGTDSLGYDELGRLMYGGQASLEVGVAAALLATVFGAVYGALSGLVGGAVDAVMMRFVDGVLSVPSLFLLILLRSVFKPSKWVLVLVIAAFAWLGAARLVRGATLSLRVRDFVVSLKLMGARTPRTVLRHILPNVLALLLVFATISISDSILALAALGYLGLGLQAPDTDWGSMLSQGVVFLSNGYWWLIYPAGVAIVLSVLALNLMGDSIRDATDSRLRSFGGGA